MAPCRQNKTYVIFSCYIRSDITLVFILEKFFQDIPPPPDFEFHSTCVSSPYNLPNAKATDLKRKKKRKKESGYAQKVVHHGQEKQKLLLRICNKS